MAHPFDHLEVRKRNLEYVRRAHRRLQSWSRRLARAKTRTEKVSGFCESLDSPPSSHYAPRNHESDEDDFDNAALVDRAHLSLPDRDATDQQYEVDGLRYSFIIIHHTVALKTKPIVPRHVAGSLVRAICGSVGGA